jgi:glycosyltransferase involved in cell wall biosynthesis
LDYDQAAFDTLASAADVVFVQRVTSEQLVRRLREVAAPVIFDFDDALHYVRHSQHVGASTWDSLRSTMTSVYRSVRRGGRYFTAVKPLVEELVSLSRLTIVGNEWLRAEFAGSASEIIVIPTSVPIQPDAPKLHAEKRPIRIGWVGLKDNLFELDYIGGALTSLHTYYGSDVVLSVSSSMRYTPRSTIPCENIPWSTCDEQRIVRSFDVGLMPLHDIPFARGKCAFKALLCMSHGIPVVASPVGANATIVRHGLNGYLASTDAEWKSSLSALVEDAPLRTRLGANAFEMVRQNYTPHVVSERVREAIESVMPGD